MHAAVVILVFIGLAATTHADQHQPCNSPNMTGMMSVMSLKGEFKALGEFTYDSEGKRLRFKSNEQVPQAQLKLDVLMLFKEGIFYKIDSKNQICEKKSLHSTDHPLQIPSDATFFSTINVGSASIAGEGIKVNVWIGSFPGQGNYSMSVTKGCFPMSSFYLSESNSLLFSNLEIENEIKVPDALVVPSFCKGQPVEETPEGTFNCFISMFM